jgi:hypothetical protein
MAAREFMYKGKTITISEGHPDAVITVDGREFACHHHHPEGDGLSMWMCDEAYFASPDIEELARHFADYGYMFDHPGRIVVDASGDVVKTGKDQNPSKEPEEPTKKDGGSHGGGH